MKYMLDYILFSLPVRNVPFFERFIVKNLKPSQIETLYSNYKESYKTSKSFSLIARKRFIIKEVFRLRKINPERFTYDGFVLEYINVSNKIKKRRI